MKVQTRGSIRIELSLKPNQLKKNHIGYQNAQKKYQEKNESKPKQEPKKYK